MKKLEELKNKIFGDWSWNEVLLVVVFALVIIGFIAFTLIGCSSSSKCVLEVSDGLVI